MRKFYYLFSMLWCKSLDGWKQQLQEWMKEASWESVRNLQIFYDARTIKGDEYLIRDLKDVFYEYQKQHPSLLKRFMEHQFSFLQINDLRN